MDNSFAAFTLARMDIFDLIILGGGLNGPALALAAAQAGMRVCLIDPAPEDAPTDFDGRAYALSHGSHRLLANLGLWQELGPLAQPMAEIKVCDARPGEPPAPQILHFQSDEIHLSPMGFMLEDRHLRAAYAGALRNAAGIIRLTGKAIAQQTSGPRASVTLEDGREVSGVLIAGCDGRASPAAARAGIARTGWDYGQTGLVCTLAHAQPHGGIAHQMFLPSGPLAILPLTGNRCSIVWSERTARAQTLAAGTDADFMAALHPVFGDFLGEITLTGPRYAYPLNLTVAQDFVRPRLALVGDAAHGMHPVAGQGLNAGLRDVAALVEVLSGARQRGEDIGALPVLERYQKWRRFEVMRLVAATDIVTRGFSNESNVLRPLRAMAMGAINALPDLRRAFIREASGTAGTLPALMR